MERPAPLAFCPRNPPDTQSPRRPSAPSLRPVPPPHPHLWAPSVHPLPTGRPFGGEPVANSQTNLRAAAGGLALALRGGGVWSQTRLLHFLLLRNRVLTSLYFTPKDRGLCLAELLRDQRGPPSWPQAGPSLRRQLWSGRPGHGARAPRCPRAAFLGRPGPESRCLLLPLGHALQSWLSGLEAEGGGSPRPGLRAGSPVVQPAGISPPSECGVLLTFYCYGSRYSACWARFLAPSRLCELLTVRPGVWGHHPHAGSARGVDMLVECVEFDARW